MDPIGTDTQTGRILIVEDNYETIELLEYFLRPAGYEIFTNARNG